MVPQFSTWMGKSGKVRKRPLMSLILPCSSLTASCAKCLHHEDVKHSENTSIASGNTDQQRILFIAPLGKLNQIKPCFICWGRRLFLIVPAILYFVP